MVSILDLNKSSLLVASETASRALSMFLIRTVECKATTDDCKCGGEIPIHLLYTRFYTGYMQLQ